MLWTEQMLEVITLASIFVLVSSWERCMLFHQQQALPYPMGFHIFSMLQWIFAAVALIKIFGWLYGIIALVLCMSVLHYITHFTLGIIYNLLFKNNPLPTLGLFGIMVWVTGGLAVALLFFG
jgi:hypothetical protein